MTAWVGGGDRCLPSFCGNASPLLWGNLLNLFSLKVTAWVTEGRVFDRSKREARAIECLKHRACLEFNLHWLLELPTRKNLEAERHTVGGEMSLLQCQWLAFTLSPALWWRQRVWHPNWSQMLFLLGLFLFYSPQKAVITLSHLRLK